MTRPVRRCGTAVLVITLVTSLLSTTQAGIIPWIYDVVFGPVRPQSYSSSYYRGYGPCAPAPCSPCATFGAASPCGPSGCRTTAFRSPCPTACQTSSDQTVTKLVPTPDPVDVAPKPKTFVTESQVPDPHETEKKAAEEAAVAKTNASTGAEGDIQQASGTADAKPADARVEQTPATVSAVADPGGDAKAEASDESAGSKVETDDEGFAKPIKRNQPEGTSGESVPGAQQSEEGDGGKAPGLPEAADDADLKKALDLDKKSSWNVPRTPQRISVRAAFRNARIARRSIRVDQDYVLPTSSTTRIAGR